MIEYLSCIHCNRTFKKDEIFLAYINEDMTVIISTCLDCGEVQTKPERQGTGWIVLRRDYDKYEIMSRNE